MSLRDHEPIVIDEFNGLWARGDFDSCPKDHWTDCGNVDFSESSFFTRFPFTKDYPGNVKMVRQQIFANTSFGLQKVFILGLDGAGVFYKQQISPAPADPNPVALLSIPGTPIDFDMVNFNGKAYIVFSGASTGLLNQKIYIFDGTLNFRVAGFDRPALGAFNVVQSAAGFTSPGEHAIAICYVTSTGFVTQPRFFPTTVNNTGKGYDLTNIPIGPAGVVARRIVVSKADVTGSNIPVLFHNLFFLQEISDNTTTAITISFYDAQLVQDVSYLLTIFDHPPTGLGISKYHNRLVVWGYPTATIALNLGAVTVNVNPTTMILSNVNDPETFDSLNNFIIIDPNATGFITDIQGLNQEIGLTDCQEYRDLLYACKITKTYALTDNGDVPATWGLTVVDEGSGSFVKGIATVLDTGGVNYEYLLIANPSGMFVFNGLFQRPEVSFKVADLWKKINLIPGNVNFPSAGKNHFVLDSTNKKIYFLCSFTKGSTAPDTVMLIDAANAFNSDSMGNISISKNVRWANWKFSASYFLPTTLFGWDVGGNFLLMGNDSGSFFNWVLNGVASVKEVVTSSFAQTYLITDDDEGIIHLGGIRFRINGVGAGNLVNVAIFNQDGTYSINLVPFQIKVNMGLDPTPLANFMGQKFYIKIAVPDGGYMDVNKIIPYVKPVYASLPG